jgi:ABC-2 type transport system permease protein
MTLWRVEVLRLWRTGRIWIIVGIYVLFGVIGPLGARYLPEILERFGGGVEVVVPEPTALDGMGQFASNAGQLGLLAVLAVAAAALAFDARPQWAAFLRTRTSSVRALVVPRVVASTLAAAVGLAVGSVVAAVLTGLLIAPVPVGDLLLGIVLGALYLAFAVAVVAVASSIATQTMSAVLLAVGVLLVLPIVQLVPAVEDWVPSRLLGATTALMAGASPGDLLPAVVVTLVLVPVLVVVAERRLDRREA